MDKKGNINLLMPAILALTLGAILLVFGLLMLDTLEDNTYESTTGTILNVTTVGAVNYTGSYVTGYNPDYLDGCSLTVDAAKLENGTIISSGNYTVSGCIINGSTAISGINNSIWVINGSATYNARTAATNATNETITGLGTFADYYDLLVLAVAIAIIISLLLVVFSMRKKQ